MIVDNSNNSIDTGFTEVVTAANADGTYVVQSEPTNPSAIVNGTNYAIIAETQTYNTGQQTGYSFTAPGGATYSCTLDPHGSGPDFPIRVGQTWSLDYMDDCGGLPAVAYTQAGSVVDVESVTVPAGTYSTLKLQSTLTWMDAQGTTRTQSVTNWRDVVTSISVKQEISISYSGSLPSNGYAVRRTILLLSAT